jgi:hypothetical protein
VSLHTAKEVSDLYAHSKSAADIENERRPWRRLKRTALRDAEALAESVIGIPAEDLRRRFRGVIGRRVLVTLSSIAVTDDSAPELQATAHNTHSSGEAPAKPAAEVIEQVYPSSHKVEKVETAAVESSHQHQPAVESKRQLV